MSTFDVIQSEAIVHGFEGWADRVLSPRSLAYYILYHTYVTQFV